MHVRVTWHIHNKVSSSRHTTPSTLAANSMGQRLLPTGRRRAPREPSRLTAPSSSPGDPGPQAACRPTRADGNWAAIRRTLAVLPSVRVLIPSTPLALAVHRHTNQTLSRSMSRAPRAREAASGVRCPQHQSPVWSAGGMGGLYTWAPHGDRTLCKVGVSCPMPLGRSSLIASGPPARLSMPRNERPYDKPGAPRESGAEEGRGGGLTQGRA